MKRIFTLALILSLAFSSLFAQTIWTGPKIVFEKADGADWTLEENQDRLTDSVWITRANNKGLFNVALNDEFIGNGANPAEFGPSPEGTEWAYGTTADGIENLEFTSWMVATTVNDTGGEAVPTTLIDKDMVVHLIADDIYLDIKLLTWAVGGQDGMGGFSYERATNDVTNIPEVTDQEVALAVFPNPTSDFLSIKNLDKRQSVIIFNAVGNAVQQAQIDSSDQLDIADLAAGVYFIRLEDGRHTTFVKR
jgi:hypothetical protein